ncbi:uncharacterized protein LOC126857347 isoform X2 [Cataglyphis hispanica]|uniref:uncharacterized protein LOC126857347 isoform X2 n=1 Tax=Cataglyphis hispanica TaxID=1086592 RepID=UPI0021805C00|nr:uncharacterized protein LOC126857347 isoform X2 [Cataglyphis hispanica]
MVDAERIASGINRILPDDCFRFVNACGRTLDTRRNNVLQPALRALSLQFDVVEAIVILCNTYDPCLRSVWKEAPWHP